MTFFFGCHTLDCFNPITLRHHLRVAVGRSWFWGCYFDGSWWQANQLSVCQRIGSEKNRMFEIQRTSGISMNLRHIVASAGWLVHFRGPVIWQSVLVLGKKVKWFRGLWSMIIQVAVGDQQAEGFYGIFWKVGQPLGPKNRCVIVPSSGQEPLVTGQLSHSKYPGWLLV